MHSLLIPIAHRHTSLTLSLSVSLQTKGEPRVPRAPLARLAPDYLPSFPPELNTSNALDEGDLYPNNANSACRLGEHRCVGVIEVQASPHYVTTATATTAAATSFIS